MEQAEDKVASGRWPKLLWSLCIIAALWFLKSRLEAPPVDEGAGITEYIVFAAAWIAGGVAGLSALAFRLLKVMRRTDYFGYIFCGVLDLAVATVGIYSLWHSPARGASPAEWCLLAATGLVGVFILADAFLGSSQR